MRVKLEFVMCTDDGREETVADIVTLQKNSQRRCQLIRALAHFWLSLVRSCPARILMGGVVCFFPWFLLIDGGYEAADVTVCRPAPRARAGARWHRQRTAEPTFGLNH